MRWQWYLQQMMGGLKRIPGAEAQIIQGGNAAAGQCRLGITADSIQDLRAGRVPVLVCSGAVSAAFCHLVAERLEAVARSPQPKRPGAVDGAATRFSSWRLTADPCAPPSDYAKLGYTKTDVLREEGFRMAAGRPAPQRYLQQAKETYGFLRDAVFAPHCCPISEISEELSSLPGITCQLERCPALGEPFLPCVVRRMVAGARRAAGNLHMDTTIPGRTFSINVYLRVPKGEDAGGELVLYPLQKGPLSRVLNSHFFTTVEIQNFYPDHTFYTDELLTSSSIEPIVYRPKAGDVVILDPAYPHAVRDFRSASGLARISLQTFLQTSWKDGKPVFEYAV